MIARAPFVPLDTRRLSLIPLALEHAAAVYAYASDPELRRLQRSEHLQSVEQARELVARSLVSYLQGGYYEWAVVRRCDGVFLGLCGFGEVASGASIAEVGYGISKPHRGQGYATEALTTVVDYGFSELHCDAIEAKVFADNERSLRVLTKLGFQYTGTRSLDEDAARTASVQVYRLAREGWRV